jgi:hypothetical protein
MEVRLKVGDTVNIGDALFMDGDGELRAVRTARVAGANAGTIVGVVTSVVCDPPEPSAVDRLAALEDAEGEAAERVTAWNDRHVQASVRLDL